MNKPIISVKNLTKNYGDFVAVNSISFDVYEGEIFGLLGPNGAGKSTTLEIIETLREKTSGEVMVNGFDLDKQPEEIKKIIGVQLQSSGFYPGLNLLELINLFGGLYNRPVNPMELLKKVNLIDKAKNKSKELSGGQKQRFSIATTLINNPKIVVIDGGINDLLSGIPTQRIFKNYQQIIEVLSEKKIKTIAHLILYTTDNEEINKEIFILNFLLKEYFESRKVEFIDMNLQLSDHKKLKKNFSIDGIHLRKEAYKMWANQLKSKLPQEL